MSSAPYCNVSVATPKADPQKPLGLQQIPRGATNEQIINITNNNFNQLIKGNYFENKALRQTIVTRVFDPSDPNIWVDVRQITALHFVNPLTGQTIVWKQ
jgi:hypothetical protein